MRHSWLVLLALVACQKSESKHDAGKKPGQVVPPYDLKTPPPDAVKRPSGLVYKKEIENGAGQAPHKNDTVIINYTGWQPSTGDTFFTTKTRGQPMPLNLATSPPGFTVPT